MQIHEEKPRLMSNIILNKFTILKSEKELGN